jgi:hypothetical protein
MDDTFREDIWLPVLDTIVSVYISEKEFAEEYYIGEEHWDGNSYLALENPVDESNLEIGGRVHEILEEYNLSTSDLIQFIDDEVTSDDLEYTHTHMKAYYDKTSVTVWSTPIGEMEHQVDDDLFDAYKNLSIDDQMYVDANVKREVYLSKRGDTISVDFSYDIANFFFTWKSVEDKFNDWLDKTGKTNLSITASIGSSDEKFIQENANEENIEIDWTVLNKEIAEYELEVVSYLKKNKDYINVRDEGHDDVGLAVVFDVVDKALIKEYKDLIDRQESFSFSDSSYSADSKLFKLINKLISSSKFLHLCDLRIYFY